jgi:hypothetical protein
LRFKYPKIPFPPLATAALAYEEQFYATLCSRRTRILRPTRNKIKDPQCVTLSSSEDEADLPATSGTSEEPAAKTSTEAPQPEQRDERARDLIRWKEAGFKGSYFAVTCRSARIGSYKVAPTDRVLFSSEGIMIEVPIMNAEGKPSSEETAKLALFIPQILKLDVHYGKNTPAIFIFLIPMASRAVRESLKMTRNDSGI